MQSFRNDPMNKTTTAAIIWRKLCLPLLLLLLCANNVLAAGSTTVVISQIYGGGGNTSATYKNDFIELHNVSSASVSISGWSVQYASASGTSWSVTALSGTSIPAGGYYLIQEASGGTPGSTLPTSDNTAGTINLSASSGKVVLANTTTAFTVASPSGSSVVDLVGFGSANGFETAVATGPSDNVKSLQRKNNGMQDTDNNSSDFTASSTAAARNSSTAAYGPPSLSTQAASILSVNSATLNGTISANNGSTLTDRGFYWSTSPTVTTASIKLAEGGTTVATYSTALTGLSVNTIYYYRAYAVNAAGSTLDTADTSFYTLANTPGAPTVNNPTTFSLDVTIGSGDGNPSATTYAIKEAGGQFVQAGGTLGASAVYQTLATWGTKTVSGLSAGTLYSFTVQAKNGAGTTTSFGSSSSGTTTSAATYTVTYDGNGNTVGTAPVDSSSPYTSGATVTVLDKGTLVKSGSSFASWNTVAGGGGTAYSPGNTFTITANTTLYAQWSSTPTITLGGTLSAVNTTYGAASASPASFTVSGVNLTGNLTVAPPSGFEVSLSSGSGYTTSLTITASGTVVSTPVYVRLAATAAVSGSPYSGNITVSGGGADPETIATVSSTVAQVPLTIIGLTGVSKVYDRTTTATTTGTAAYSGLANGESFSVTGTPTFTFSGYTIGTGKSITVSGYTAPSGNYTVTQPTLTADITPLALTIPDAAVTTKAFDGKTNATITGTLTGVISPDSVTYTNGGYFADTNAGTGIPVTATLSLTGADATNYSLTQPTGLTGTITKANQTITFGALPSKTTSDAPFNLTATASSGLTVTYVSGTPSVATVSGSSVTIVAVGSTVITASQAGNGNYNAATDVPQTLTVTPPPIAAWIGPWVGNTTNSPSSASFADANLAAASLARSGLGAGSGNARFNSTGWNTTANYLTVTLTSASGYVINLNGAALNGYWGSSATGPASFDVRSSVDGYASSVGTINSTSSGSTFTSITLPSSGYNGLSSITFRFIGSLTAVNGSATGSSGTGGLTNLTVNGSVAVAYLFTTNAFQTVSTPSNAPVSILIAKVLSKTTGGQGTLTLSSFSNGTHGTVTTNATSIIYTPDGTVGSDSFNCVVKDGNGLTTTVTVLVTVTDPGNPALSGQGGNGSNLTIKDLGDNSVRIIVSGTATVTYRLQYSTDLSTWQPLVDDFVMPGVGLTNFTDTVGPGVRFYRTVLP